MKNTLVQYQGGGYSGCFWEWNYFFLDKDGEFHDIFSSGSAGIETAERARELLESGIECDVGKYAIPQTTNTFFTYDLTGDKVIIEFSKECNVVNITGVLQWFCENPQPGIDFFAVCSACGDHIDNYNDLTLEDWHGCGGIQTTADTLICCDCCVSWTCGCCDGYVGEGNLFYLEEYKPDDEYKERAAQQLQDDGLTDVCADCLEYRAGLIEEEDQEDMLWASRTTGKPDVFSKAMRWFWDVLA